MFSFKPSSSNLYSLKLNGSLSLQIGFKSADTMLQSVVTSAFVLSILIALRVAGVSSRLVTPFQLGLSTFGGIALFLAGLIRTSLFYFWNPYDGEGQAR